MFLQNFAQTAGECTVNGQPVDCSQAAQAAGGVLAGFGIFMLIFFGLGILSTIIWILGLIHLAQHDDVDNRVLWIVLITIVPLANFVYYFGFKRSYDKKHQGEQPQAGTGGTPAATPGVVSPQDNSGGNIATGAVAGGAATAGSGFVTPDSSETVSPSAVADSSDQQPVADLGLQDDEDSSGGGQVAQANSQADSAPVFSSGESPADTPADTTDSVVPETNSYQSGSTEEPAPAEDSVSQPEDSDSSGAGGDGFNTQGPGSDENTSGSSGPAIG